jgi:hypothetical protein
VHGKRCRKRGTAAAGEQIDDVVPLEIDQYAPVGPSPSECKVVHAEDADNGHLSHLAGAYLCEERIATHADAQATQHPCSWLTAAGEGDLLQPVSQAFGATCMRTSDPWEPFGENAARAVRRLTKEAPRPE